ncbi:Peptidase_M16_C domain-containing protein [Cephalotus follicularis]|uniref:Peptidase_M16_C domain-containing protein n=1 Tax=Cephalotus follicularis TaxID=3775 RepID=A0A1Q3C9M1_CEPFO|nr:Peptidase_M16_C domain-containing protein [Cephalotus follicularis]
MLDDDIPLAQFGVDFNRATWIDIDSIALMVMQAMNKSVGSEKHIDFELPQKVVIIEMASMMAFNTNDKDTSLFYVYKVAKPNCLDNLAYAYMHETTKLVYRVSEAKVTHVRNQDLINLSNI